MRRKCRKTEFIFRTVIVLLLICCCAELPAQDSIPAGVIKVHRPPVPAVYRVNMQYLYPPKSVRRSREAKIDGDAIVFSDSMKNVINPQPFFFSGDTSLRSQIRKNLATAMYMADSTTWFKFYEAIGYSFSRMDTSRIDSARFTITVRRNGETKITALPWPKADSTCRAFEQAAGKSIGNYLYWSPARLRSHRKRKRKTIDSTVILTIYAMDPTYGKFLPIENKVR